MNKPFFPVGGQRVVPIVTLNSDDDVTLVEARKNGLVHTALKLRIFRITIGSLLKATWMHIDGDNCKVTYRKRE